MSGVDPVASETAIQFLAEENKRLQVMVAQTVGNLALARKQLEEARAELAEFTASPEQVDMHADGATDRVSSWTGEATE